VSMDTIDRMDLADYRQIVPKLRAENAQLRERIAALEAERDALVDALQSVRALARAIAHHPESMIDLCDAAIDAARAALDATDSSLRT